MKVGTDCGSFQITWSGRCRGGTFSKAFGVVGGVVAGNARIIEWLRQRGRPFLFSSAVTVPDVAATGRRRYS